ncbi:MAG TPA: hypothetical protein VMV68_06685 [Spirochaetia bacterium]|nr:hypothetical protein [Spirochaetia bacterium]
MYSRIAAKKSRTAAGRRALVICLPALLALILTACNPNGAGIFYSLENEKKVTNASNLSSAITVGSMVHYMNASTAAAATVNAYYAAAGVVYAVGYDGTTATTTGSQWNTVGAPDSTHTWCEQVAVLDNDSGTATLYAIYAKPDGSEAFLYKGTPSSQSAVQTLTWTPVTGFDSSNFLAESLYTAGPAAPGTDFAFVTALNSDGSYSLYSWDGLVKTQYTYSHLSANVVGVTYDSVSGTYYFAAGSNYYSATSGAFASRTVNDTSASSPARVVGSARSAPTNYGGIYWSSTLSTLFLSTRDGYVYATSNSGASWVSNGSAVGYGMNGLAELTLAGTEVVVIGSDSGYYEVHLASGWTDSTLTIYQPSTSTGALTADANYPNLLLKTAAVRGFLTETVTGGTGLFAVSTSGLWFCDEGTNGLGSWIPE